MNYYIERTDRKTGEIRMSRPIAKAETADFLAEVANILYGPYEAIRVVERKIEEEVEYKEL